MASITKQKSGWRVQLSIGGVRDSKMFSTKAEGQAWASERETALRKRAQSGINTDKTLADAFDRYVLEISVHKRGAKWEEKRLAAIAKDVVDGEALGQRMLCDITADLLGQWRDMRMRGTAAKNFADKVTGSTINRDLALVSNVFTVARREWKWIKESPTSDVRRPQNAPPRDRRISDDEIDRVCLALGYDGTVTGSPTRRYRPGSRKPRPSCCASMRMRSGPRPAASRRSKRRAWWRVRNH